MALCHSGRDFGTRRIHHDLEPHEGEVALDILGRVIAHGIGDTRLRVRAVERAVRHREHAQAVGGVRVVRLHDALAELLGHGLDHAVHTNMGRKPHDLVRCALRERDAARPVQRVLKGVHGRHALAAALERQLLHTGHARLELGAIDAALLRGNDEARLRGVTVNLVALALLFRLGETRVAAEQPAFEQELEVGIVHSAPTASLGFYLTLGRVPHAGDLVFARRRPQMVHGHLVLRERTGLIRADHARGAKRLHGIELLHQGVPATHALHRHSERKRHRGQQAFGNECHDHAEREDERRRERLVHHEQGQAEERDAHAHGKDRDLLREAVELTCERALRRLHVLREARDLAELRVHANAEHHGAAVALRHARTSEDEVGNLRGGKPLFEHRVRGLARRGGFAV